MQATASLRLTGPVALTRPTTSGWRGRAGGGGGGGRYDDVRLEDFGAIVMLLLASKEDTVNLRALDKLKSDPSRYNDADIAELTSVLTVAPTLYEQKKGYGGFRSDNLAQLRRFLEDLPVR